MTLFTALLRQFDCHPQKISDIKKAYQRQPSLSESLPWMEYDPERQCFLLDDGVSVGAVFELADVPSEGRSEDYLNQLQQGLQGVFQDVFPAYFDDESPWIVQFFVQDELSLEKFYTEVENYVKPAAKQTKYTQNYLNILKQHTEFLTQSQGIFTDTKVSGTVFRGRVRKVRAVVYRLLTGKAKRRRGRSAIQDLNTVAQTFVSKFESCGVKVKRYGGKEFYDWMVRWFNPASKQGDGNTDTLLKRCPYPNDDEMPFGYDFSERLFFSVPKSDHEKGVWYFDGKPHKYAPILGLNTLPQIGHLTRERSFGNYAYGLFDRFPEDSVFQMTVVIQSQEAVKNHLFRIEHSTKRATSTEAEMAREDCALAKRSIESGNYFFPVTMGVYLRGDNIDDLYDKETDIETILSSNGFWCLSSDQELTPVDSYLRFFTDELFLFLRQEIFIAQPLFIGESNRQYCAVVWSRTRHSTSGDYII
jgi:hypothetical protein